MEFIVKIPDDVFEHFIKPVYLHLMMDGNRNDGEFWKRVYASVFSHQPETLSEAIDSHVRTVEETAEIAVKMFFAAHMYGTPDQIEEAISSSCGNDMGNVAGRVIGDLEKQNYITYDNGRYKRNTEKYVPILSSLVMTHTVTVFADKTSGIKCPQCGRETLYYGQIKSSANIREVRKCAVCNWREGI